MRSPVCSDALSSGAESSCESEEGRVNSKRRLLFLVNPASGSGQAVKLFKRKVMPLLEASADHTDYQVLVTSARDSAFNFLKKLKLSELMRWSGVVIVSGDGLLFEVFNALLSRPDWPMAIKTPIGIIPAGSGNGLAYSISYANGELQQDQVIAATHNVLSGRSVPMDIVKITNSKKIYYSFLSIGWGLIADIDIESEHLRILGGGRFTLWALVRTISLRKYQGRLHFLPVPSYQYHLFEQKRKCQNTSSLKNSSKRHINKYNSLQRPATTQSIDDCEEVYERRISSHSSELPNDYLDVQLLKYTTIADKSFDIDQKLDELNHNFDHLTEHTKEEKEDGLISNSSESLDTFNAAPSSLFKPLTSDWITVEGDFVLVYATYQSHISHDCKFAPDAKMDDNVIWLLYLKGDLSRKQVLQFLLCLDSGSHVNLPFVHMVPVQAFRLEPLTSKSRVTVDGELIANEPLQAEIMPCAARMLCK